MHVGRKMKLTWEPMGENFYNVTLDDQEMGSLQRGPDYNWILNIPKLNIRRTGKHWHDLMEYAEKRLKEELR
jgi:hypothetical protein